MSEEYKYINPRKLDEVIQNLQNCYKLKTDYMLDVCELIDEFNGDFRLDLNSLIFIDNKILFHDEAYDGNGQWVPCYKYLIILNDTIVSVSIKDFTKSNKWVIRNWNLDRNMRIDNIDYELTSKSMNPFKFAFHCWIDKISIPGQLCFDYVPYHMIKWEGQ